VTAAPAPELPDAAARIRISEDTGSTLFVEAGAGSGKTKSLVDRVSTLVLTDGVPLSAIAAVTFTEKAGAELRDRLRARFEERWLQARRRIDTGTGAGTRTGTGSGTGTGGGNGPGAPEPADLERVAAQALDDLDSAAIGTLHSFAQRILSLHPIEAGLPPLVEVLDEVASSVAFDERWSVLQRELLDDPELSEPLLMAMGAGLSLDDLRSLARAFGANWDLIEDRVLPGGPPAVVLPDPAQVVRQAELLAARADECRDSADKFLDKLVLLRDWVEQANAARDDAERHAALIAAANLKWSFGRAGSWPDLAGLKESCVQWQTEVAALAAQFAEATLRPLAYWIATRVLAAADERAAEGRLEFHDLLVLARRLLASRGDVRDALRRRFRVLLLDEFQDTDPIQIELAVRIAGGAAADAPDWQQVTVPPGALFVVGDPKQSIYRFRRASIATYLQAQQHLGESVSLTTNFRTVGPALDWINAVFGELIQPEPEAQPAFQPLDTFRSTAGNGPAVVLLGAEEHQDKPNAAQLREREAGDVAAAIARALAEQWTVWDPAANGGRDGWRPIELRDIAVLVPSRTSLPFLQDALDDAGIGYRAESSSLVYQAQEVRDLMAAVRVLADPTDQLACVTALRSPLFGCGDDDLWTWRNGGGSFSIQAPTPEPLAGSAAGSAIDYLRALHRRVRWMTPSQVLTALVTDRRMLEVAADRPRARDSWRRLRFVIDQARAWSETERGGLRAYLAWAARQADETSRVAEAILPETDVDAVRIMTVHAAKGLEFPMVVLSGMSSMPQNRPGVRLLWPPQGGYEIKLSKYLETNDFQNAAPVDEQMDALERRRLLYVAATRARDHLVVSLHRKAVGKEAVVRTNAQLLVDAGALGAPGAVGMPADESVVHRGRRAPEVRPPPDWESWLAGITAARNASRRPAAISASGLEGTEPAVVFAAARSSAGAMADMLHGSGTAGGDGSAGDSEMVDAARFQGPPDDARTATAGNGPPIGAEDVPDATELPHTEEVPGATELPDAEVVAGRAKGPRDLELPPWTKGRYGTAVGRAVHAVLQSVDLAGAVPAGRQEAIAAQCLAEGVLEYADVVAGLVGSALASPVVARAAARPHWRETWVATTQSDGIVLEGIVDLLYREDDGSLVIVDYKTDAVPAGALPARSGYYRPQLAAYATALRAATDARVTGTLLFLHPTSAAVDVPVDVDAPAPIPGTAAAPVPGTAAAPIPGTAAAPIPGTAAAPVPADDPEPMSGAADRPNRSDTEPPMLFRLDGDG
jgi:ATP-dependent exoDNAse (exonuclease V) beta subunit